MAPLLNGPSAVHKLVDKSVSGLTATPGCESKRSRQFRLGRKEMAYARRSSRRSTGRRTVARRSGGRSGYARRRSTGVRSRRSRSGGSARTVKIVIEQAAANTVARPAGEGAVVAPRKARF